MTENKAFDLVKALEAYRVIEERFIKEMDSAGMILEHVKSGARIFLMSNDDSNKVFSIGFRTPPADSTGLPHILEHSVLEGSDKFPVKDPFVELVKGSLNTFLNAMTYPDKTVYPIASCNAQDYHNRIADHYGIPHVSIKDTVYPDVESGKIVRADITPDNLHPNDKGHRLVAEEICKLLDSIKAEVEEETIAGKSTKTEESILLPTPLTENAYEHSRLIQIQDNEAILDGFLVDPIEKKGMLDIFKNGWTAAHTNDKISFEIECSCLAVQYRKSVQQPVPKAKAVIDGDEAHAVILDGNFTEDWGDCLYLEPLLHHAEKKVHRIEITITDAKDIVRPFYLVSLIVS